MNYREGAERFYDLFGARARPPLLTSKPHNLESEELLLGHQIVLYQGVS